MIGENEVIKFSILRTIQLNFVMRLVVVLERRLARLNKGMSSS